MPQKQDTPPNTGISPAAPTPDSMDHSKTPSEEPKSKALKKQDSENLLNEIRTVVKLEKVNDFPWAPRQAFLPILAENVRSPKEHGFWVSKDLGVLVIYWPGRIAALRKTPHSVISGKIHDLENQAKDIAHSFNLSGYLKTALADPPTRKKAVDESPWPFDLERCSVIHLEDLYALYKGFCGEGIPKLKKRGGYRFKSHTVTLNLSLLGSVIPNTEYETPHLMRMKRPDDFVTLREMSLRQKKSTLNFQATWRKSGWAFTLPSEITEDDPSELLSHLQMRKGIDPTSVSVTKGINTYYTRLAFEWFSDNSPLNHIFYRALLEFMAVATEKRDLIIPNAPKYTPVPPEERKTKARWTKDELKILTQVFGADENGSRTSVTSEWDWENVFKHLQPHHRSKLEVQRKIASMNVQLKKSLQINGIWTEAGKLEFAKRRLGQLARTVK